jgi:hypothetical protein
VFQFREHRVQLQIKTLDPSFFLLLYRFVHFHILLTADLSAQTRMQ